MSEIVGILLAAGSSRRFGSDKRWHRLADGTPMAVESGRRLLAACSHSVAVLRPDDSELARALTDLGMQVVFCAEAVGGMGHSLAAGVATAAEAKGWLVALADMPGIAGTSYRAVLDTLLAGAGIVRPTLDGQVGHPVGFAAAYRDALLSLTGDRGGKAIIAAHPAAVVDCPVSDPGILFDIDTPAAV